MTYLLWHEPRGWCWGTRFPDQILSRFYRDESTARDALLTANPQAIIRTLHLEE